MYCVICFLVTSIIMCFKARMINNRCSVLLLNTNLTIVLNLLRIGCMTFTDIDDSANDYSGVFLRK